MGRFVNSDETVEHQVCLGPTGLIRYHYVPSTQALLSRTVPAILDIASQSIREREEFKFVLSGGNTPRKLYERLAESEAEWPNWRFFLADERCVSRDHLESTAGMIERLFLDRIGVPDENKTFVCGELGARKAAEVYERGIHGVGMFDLVLLGMGADGHTASLFPGLIPESAGEVIPVFNAPKNPAERVSLTTERLSRSNHVFLLAIGEAKHLALAAMVRGESLPISSIQPRGGMDVFTDCPWSVFQ